MTLGQQTPTFLIGASEKPGIVHEVGLLVVRLGPADTDPEEVVRLLSLVKYLKVETFLFYSPEKLTKEYKMLTCSEKNSGSYRLLAMSSATLASSLSALLPIQT